MAVSLLAFGLRRSYLWECYPRGSHISRLLTGGSLGFRIVLLLLPFFRPTPSWLPPGPYTHPIAAKRWIVIVMQVLLFLPGSQIAVWHFRCLLFVLVLFCHTNHLFWFVSDDYELTSWSPAVLFLLCVLFCVVWVVWVLFFFCFVVFVCLFCIGSMLSHGKSSMDHVSILIQFLFWCTLSIRWCCHFRLA